MGNMKLVGVGRGCGDVAFALCASFEVAIEILGAQRGQVSCQAFERCTPKSGYHVGHKSECCDNKSQSGHAQILNVTVVRELDFAQQIQTQESKYNNPNAQINFSIEDSPMVGLIRNAQEFQCECQFHEAQNHFYAV